MHTSWRSSERYSSRAEWPGANTTREAAMMELSARGGSGAAPHALVLHNRTVRSAGRQHPARRQRPRLPPAAASRSPAGRLTGQLHARNAAVAHDYVLHLGTKAHLAPQSNQVGPA